jgi:hypothetical protein
MKDEFEFDSMTENQFSDKVENAEPDMTDGEEVELELPHTVKLSREYTVGSKTFSELVFKHPVTVKLLKHIPASSDLGAMKIGHFVPVIAGMTEMPKVVIEELLPKDFMLCAEVASAFL